MAYTTPNIRNAFSLSLSGSNNATQIRFAPNIRDAYFFFENDNGRLQMSGTNSSAQDGAALSGDYTTIVSGTSYHLALQDNGNRRGPNRYNDVFIATDGAGGSDVVQVRAETRNYPVAHHDWIKLDLTGSQMFDPNGILQSITDNGDGSFTLAVSASAKGAPRSGFYMSWPMLDPTTGKQVSSPFQSTVCGLKVPNVPALSASCNIWTGVSTYADLANQFIFGGVSATTSGTVFYGRNNIINSYDSNPCQGTIITPRWEPQAGVDVITRLNIARISSFTESNGSYIKTAQTTLGAVPSGWRTDVVFFNMGIFFVGQANEITEVTVIPGYHASPNVREHLPSSGTF